MKRKFFWRNFFRFIAPVLILLILIGPASIIITYNYAISQSNRNNLDILSLARDNLELMLNDIDFLTVSLDNDRNNASYIKSILCSSEYSYDISKKLDLIKGLIATPTYSKPFIYSIYIYVDNPYGRFLTSSAQISNLQSTYDKTWYDSYANENPDTRQWVETRYVKFFTTDRNPQQVITVYRRLVSNQGVIVFNIRQSYFRNMIDQLTMYGGKSLIVIGPNGESLFSSMSGFNPADSGINFEKYPAGEPISVRIGSKNQLMTMIKSEKFNWTYVSLVPKDILYFIPERILVLMLLILFIALIAGFILAYSISRKNYRHIMEIINVFYAAETGKPLPQMSKHSGDEYSFILQNILKTFIEQDYLKMQLSLKQLSLKNAELLALQSQLNPHFMFNTLETINLEIMATTGEPINANRMITQLALMLRYALDRPDRTVKLKLEMENAKRYIEIQTYRYENKFFVRWNVDDSALDFLIPPLLLQPLIENSIYHGIKEKKGHCGIKLSINTGLDGLNICITDNGLGITPEMLKDIRYNLLHTEIDPGGHIGLYNVNKRLALIFGEKYRISVYSHFNVGTYIHLFLPDSGAEPGYNGS